MCNDQRKLVMEDLGFNPKSMFTDEQIQKMRDMKAEGSLGSFGKCKFGKLPDYASFQSLYKRERNVHCL